MTLSGFSQLKQQVVRSVVSCDSHSDILQALKELFKEDINSVRRFEKINTTGELLKVLELRGRLTEDNVSALKNIARKINSNELLGKINIYEDTHVPREYVNYYVSENRNGTEREILVNTSPYEFNTNKRKKERIIRTVVNEIGSSWRDLARSLKIRECDIDEIDQNYRSLATKASKMMEMFDNKADLQKWFFVLIDSLDKINRRALAKSVQEIILMNI